MIELTYRMVNLADAEMVQAISAAAYVPAYLPLLGVVPKPALEDYAAWIATGEVWLAQMSSEPRGVLVLEPRADHLLIYSVAVTPRWQGRGVGAALLALADERAAARGLLEVRLYTNNLGSVSV